MKKDEILKTLVEEHLRFLDLIQDLPDEDLLEPGITGSWSIKDILAHLNSWEAELIKLLYQAREGDRPTSVHFRGQPVDEINETWHRERLERPLDRVIDDFQNVRHQTIRRVEAFTDKELNDPRRFPWQKNIPLWKWVAEDSFEHEAEHRKEIEQWLENRQGIQKDIE